MFASIFNDIYDWVNGQRPNLLRDVIIGLKYGKNSLRDKRIVRWSSMPFFLSAKFSNDFCYHVAPNDSLFFLKKKSSSTIYIFYIA